MVNRIVERRRELQMSRPDLARAMACTTVSVWRWETDKQDPSLDTMQDLAKALHTTVDALFPTLRALLSEQHPLGAVDTEEPTHA